MQFIKTIIIGLLLVQTAKLSSQVSIYTIKDGVKTILKEGENVTLTLNDDGKPVENILIEVTLGEFRKKYKFDNILVAFGPAQWALSETPRISHTFDEDYVKKKYANVNVLNFYAFQNSEYKEQLGNVSPTSSTYYIKAGDMSRTYKYRIIGRYKTGSETYYDDQSRSYKWRDLFESTEIIRSVDVTFEENKNITVSRNYADLINTNAQVEFNGIPTLYYLTSRLNNCASRLGKISVGFGPISKQKYKHISNSISEIAEAKQNDIKAEKDKAKALELFYAWHKTSKNMCIEDDKSNADKLKQLEKSLGDAKTIDQKLDLILQAVGE